MPAAATPHGPYDAAPGSADGPDTVPAALRDIWTRMGEQDQRLQNLEASTREQHAALARIDARTGEMRDVLDAFSNLQGAFRVLEAAGKLARPVAWIAGTVTALAAAWQGVKTWGIFR
jgi:hypothetical protein